MKNILPSSVCFPYFNSRFKFILDSARIDGETSQANGDESSQVNVDESSKANSDESPQANVDESSQANGDESSQANVDESSQANGDESSQANVDESSEANGGEASQGLKISGKEKPKSALVIRSAKNISGRAPGATSVGNVGRLPTKSAGQIFLPIIFGI